MNTPVRVIHEQLQHWSAEVGLEVAFLPARIGKVDAFRVASSAISARYPLVPAAARSW